MTIEGVFHFNINVSNLDRSIDFYQRVGFVLVSQQEFAAPAGTEVGMRLTGGRGRQAVMRIGNDAATPVLDMIEWQEPAAPGAPYETLAHLGIARIALRTTGLRETYTKLREDGIEFWSEPQEFPGGGGGKVVYVCFPDPDGTMLELIEFVAG